MKICKERKKQWSEGGFGENCGCTVKQNQFFQMYM